MVKKGLERTLASETVKKVGKKVKLAGFVATTRDHGGLVFIDLVDRSGVVQLVWPKATAPLRPQYAVEVVGKVQKRPKNMVNEKIPTGKIEIKIESVKILSEAEEMPFDMGGVDLNLELPTLLDHRSLTLRHPKQKAIFKVQASIAKAFREAAEKLGCIEVFTPTIAASATEGGAEVFKIDYYDHKAYLVQSPQLYKQMMVPVFERVFLFSHAYRAEPSVTTRHLAEVVQMDCEIAFIESFEELLDALEFVGTFTVGESYKSCSKEINDFGIEKPLIPKRVPRLKLREAQEIIKSRTGKDVLKEPDLNPEDEKEICEWARKTHKSDFVTITHFPTKKRAFYTHPDPANPEYSLSYDLLFRGLEICSGSQRVNDYSKLVSAMKERGLTPEDFELYLQAFRFGMPPEGGFSFGLERMTMKVLGLTNVREASLFPRDMERVDIRL